jgi:hypothetical protein
MHQACGSPSLTHNRNDTMFLQEVKRPEKEADISLPYNAKVMNMYSFASTGTLLLSLFILIYSCHQQQHS